MNCSPFGGYTCDIAIVHLLSLLFQVTFQVLLLSDGAATFAMFRYENLDLILEIEHRVVGFDSGDGLRADAFLQLNRLGIDVDLGPMLNEIVFRVEGQLVI